VIIMTNNSIGVAVIGAGMAGRSHAHAYRTAQTVFASGAPPVRLVAVADVNTDFANHTRDRYGFERSESSWQAIADADDIDAVSIVVANHLHREIAEALLASGKHVLCEKPLASTVEDAEAMVKAAAASGLVAACGFSYRRSPAVSAIGEQIKTGALGEIQHVNGRYWCDYSADPDAPTSWRYEGPPGSGALADLGSHLVDLSEQLCGPIVKIDGAALRS
jgi:predicted dehydrogenase